MNAFARRHYPPFPTRWRHAGAPRPLYSRRDLARSVIESARGIVLYVFTPTVVVLCRHRLQLALAGIDSYGAALGIGLSCRRGLVVTVSDSHARGGGFEVPSTHNKKKTIGKGR